MSADKLLTDADFKRLADFRFALKRFLHFSEQEAAEEDLTPQQHQAMLVIRGNAGEPTNVALLASRLFLKHHTVVELVQRLEKAELVSKRASVEDRRAVVLELTARGRERLDRLSRIHRAELKKIGPNILKHLSTLNTL